MNKRRFETAFVASLILCIVLLSSALAVVLYTLTKQGSWRVNVAYGLLLTDQNDIEVNTLDFMVNRYSFETKTFKLKNLSNNAVNTTQIMPLNTAYYSFATTFVNSTILKDGFVQFTITLTDLDMNAETVYTGQFDWKIVDSFPKADDIPEPKIWFEASEIVYADDTSPYVQFVSESFDKTVYNASETVQYSFTTKNPSETYILQAYSYQIDVFNGSGFQYQVFNGMSGSMLGLLKDETNTIQHVFNAPPFNGSYSLKLTYTGHNSAPILVYTFVVQQSECYGSDIMNVVVTGFNAPNSASTIHFQIKNIDALYSHMFGFEAKILETSYVIASGDTATLNKGQTWSSPTFNFLSPSAYGTYTIRITTWSMG